MNATIDRFGYPDTMIKQYDHWVVLLRPEQPTLGSLILAALGEARAFGQLQPAAFSELSDVVPAIEDALTKLVGFEKLNYLMLMMVDPHAHFHVIPRYSGTRTFGRLELADHGWPKTPQLLPAETLDDVTRGELIARIREAWP